MTIAIWRALVATALILAAFTFGRPAEARESKWVLLGEHRVGFDAEQNVIRLNRDEGWFRSLRLDAERTDVYVNNITLVYQNGYREEIPVNRMLRAGERNSTIELAAERSFIREIVLSYRSRPNYRGEPAIVQVYADQSRENQDFVRNRYRDDEFRELAAERINLGEDRITLRPNRGERVGVIRLQARENPVFVRRVEVEFYNGEQQTEQLQQVVEQGRPSRAIDLIGERRGVKNVTVVMRRQTGDRGARLILVGRDSAGETSQANPTNDRTGRPPRLDANGVPVNMALFGREEVGRRENHDTITVGREKGQFDEIALRVLDRDVMIENITIVYENGQRDAIAINQVVRANTVTSKIRLNGERFVREIELNYRKSDRERGRATVELYGDYSRAWKQRLEQRETRRDETTGGWVLLGRQKAEMGRRETDEFVVGREKGRFRAIALIARQHSVQIRAVRIHYGDGVVEDVPLTGTLADGKLGMDESSDPIDLQGRERVIERVEIAQRTKFNLKGSGFVEVWGLKTDARFRDGDSRDVLKRELGQVLRNFLRQ